MTAPGIEEHAIVGDGRSAALVTRDGTIDWLCWPRFDSGAIFGALLDDDAGLFAAAPTRVLASRRRYLDGTNVLETRFDAPGGVLTVTDAMAVATDDEHRTTLVPEHELLRVVACTAGEVEVQVRFDPRPRFGRVPELEVHGATAYARWGGEALVLRGVRGLLPGARGLVTTLRLRGGERLPLSLVYAGRDPAVLPPMGDAAIARVERAAEWWRAWSSRTTYDGPWRDAVVRSALLLKLLCYAPSGAVVAAPTTSLPEQWGGPLNWDYRFCWLRDAALTARALFGLGHHDEADAFVNFSLHATRLTRPEIRVLYDVYGNRPGEERALALAGYRGARPVRIGNAAKDQTQLDVYGEVVDAFAQACRAGRVPDPDTASLLVGLGDLVARRWRDDDDGIWELRDGGRPYTLSKVSCWVALDRLLELDRRGIVALGAARRATFGDVRDAIDAEVRTRGFDEALGSYVQTLDGHEVDASLLLLSWYGFEEPGSPRMRSTFAAIERALSVSEGLLRRTREIDEGAFGICCFWAVEHLARGGGTLAEAAARFEAVLAHQNDVGLFAEEIDPQTGEALGNFPQAFTHIGLISAALSLVERAAASRAPRAVERPLELLR